MVWVSNSRPLGVFKASLPLQQPKTYRKNTPNIIYIENLGDAMAPMGLH